MKFTVVFPAFSFVLFGGCYTQFATTESEPEETVETPVYVVVEPAPAVVVLPPVVAPVRPPYYMPSAVSAPSVQPMKEPPVSSHRDTGNRRSDGTTGSNTGSRTGGSTRGGR